MDIQFDIFFTNISQEDVLDLTIRGYINDRNPIIGKFFNFAFHIGKSTQRGNSMKILIVDDEEMIRCVLREYVEFEGNEAFEAADGMEAVKLCRENDYDLVLMDVMMPHLDGFSAVKEIKKSKDIPVIMLSARGEEYDKLFAFEIGVDDYVTKPFSPKEVMARINQKLLDINWLFLPDL